ncbi:MAG: hypothetical protein D6746_12900 [Bacteroidetes bacterium]|nr:MAG: hypothetical protein D6746_12900 [Bacteroidota bacterium]
MAQYSKAYFSSIANLDTRSILERMLNVRPDDFTFADTMRLFGRFMPETQTTGHYFVDTPLFAVSTVTAATDNSAGSGTDWDLTLDSADHGIIQGHLLKFPSGDVGYVKTVSGDTINVISLDGSTGITVAANDKVVILSQASGEGSPGVSPRRTAPKRYEYVMQIFKAAREITDIQLGSTIEFEYNGTRYVHNMVEDELYLELMSYVSMGLLYNPGTQNNFTTSTPTLTDADGRPVTVTRGLHDWVLNGGGINLGSGLTIDLAFFANLTKALNRAGAQGEYMFLGGDDTMIPLDDTLKALNGTVLTNARLSVDGRELDFTLDRFRIYNRSYTKKRLALYSLPTHFDFTGASNHSKDFFVIPMDSVPTSGSATRLPRISVVYLKVPFEQGGTHRSWSADYAISLIRTGALAPDGPTNHEQVFRMDVTTRCGLRVLGVEHFAVGSVA